MLTSLLLALAPADDWTADYTIRVEDPLTEQVQVHLRLSGLSGEVELSLPQRYAFAMPADARLVAGPSARSSAGETIEVTPRSVRTWGLKAPSAGALELEWTVQLDHRTQPGIAGRDDYEHPYLAADHGMLSTAALLIAPERNSGAGSFSVRFELPAAWAIHAPWEAPEPGLYRPSYDELTNDLIAVGAWEVARQELDGLELTFAFAPGQAELQELVLERAPAILTEEVRLFGGPPQPRYLFLFGRPDQTSGVGGSPKTSSMTLFVSADLPAEYVRKEVVHLIAHEYHHTFMMAHCQPLDELRFAMEGFTDWTAHATPWRLEMRGDVDFEQELESQLARADRALNASGLPLIEAGGEAFFQGGDAYVACYSGGLAVALWMDIALRELGWEEGVDRFIRELWGDPAWRGGERPGLEAFFVHAEAALGAEACLPLRQHLSTVGPDPVKFFKAVGVALERRIEPLGSSPRANFDGAVVLGVDPDGAGAMVGLRWGDLLQTVNGVEVSDAPGIQRAWAQPVDDQIQLTLVREGEQMELDAPVPTRTVFDLPTAVLERLR